MKLTCTCDYTFFGRPTSKLSHFAFVSLGIHWFPNDSNYVINGDYDNHNDDKGDKNDNYVDYKDENNVNFMVIIILVVTAVMITKIMINMIMVMIYS